MSYQPNIESSRYLIDLVRAGPNASHARFLFVSSIASAQSWDDSRGPVIEDIVEPSSALGAGYGEAKFVVERVCTCEPLNYFHFLFLKETDACEQWSASDIAEAWSDLWRQSKGLMAYI